MLVTTVRLSALDTLAVRPQWVCWNLEAKRKTPYNPVTGHKASTTDSRTWGSYEAAKAVEKDYDGLGYVLSREDPFTFVDLDHCIEDGEVLPWAVEVVEALGSYTEVSPSDAGLHILLRGTKAGTYCRTGNIEIYDRDRFFTFTGKAFDGESIEDRQAELDRLYRGLFAEREQGISTVVVDGGFVGDDEHLLDKARSSSGKFRRLYDHGDTSVVGRDDSRADNLLCWHLAFWTNHDAERMDRLFRSSKLLRPKWDQRRGNGTYGELTIAHAIKTQPNAYDPKTYRVEVKNDIRETLEGCMALAVGGDWSSRSGPTDRDVYRALISTGFEYGRMVSDGVLVSVSQRDIALGASVNLKPVRKALKRLEANGFIRRTDYGTKKQSSTYVVLTRTDPINNRANTIGVHSCQTALIRNPGTTYGTIGKRNAQVIDYVHSVRRVTTLEELAEHFKVRKNAFKARNIKLLVGLELLVDREDGYITPADIRERLERELRDSGCEEAHQLQREQYERERRAWREIKSEKPTATTTVLIPKQPEPETYMVKNVPARSADGIVHHGPECMCWLCDDEAPEYISIEKELVA